MGRAHRGVEEKGAAHRDVEEKGVAHRGKPAYLNIDSIRKIIKNANLPVTHIGIKSTNPFKQIIINQQTLNIHPNNCDIKTHSLSSNNEKEVSTKNECGSHLLLNEKKAHQTIEVNSENNFVDTPTQKHVKIKNIDSKISETNLVGKILDKFSTKEYARNNNLESDECRVSMQREHVESKMQAARDYDVEGVGHEDRGRVYAPNYQPINVRRDVIHMMAQGKGRQTDGAYHLGNISEEDASSCDERLHYDDASSCDERLHCDDASSCDEMRHCGNASCECCRNANDEGCGGSCGEEGEQQADHLSNSKQLASTRGSHPLYFIL